MNDTRYELAAILASGEPGKLYSGLAVLVSTAADGAPCAALAAFDALELLVDRDVLAERAAARGEKFARSLVELRDTAFDLDNVTIWACAASVETMGVSADPPLAGVLSTPRFLRATAGARLIHV